MVLIAGMVSSGQPFPGQAIYDDLFRQMPEILKGYWLQNQFGHPFKDK